MRNIILVLILLLSAPAFADITHTHCKVGGHPAVKQDNSIDIFQGTQPQEDTLSITSDASSTWNAVVNVTLKDYIGLPRIIDPIHTKRAINKEMASFFGGGGGSPGGCNTQIQYNHNGAFAGSSKLTFSSCVFNVATCSTYGTGPCVKNSGHSIFFGSNGNFNDQGGRIGIFQSNCCGSLAGVHIINNRCGVADHLYVGCFDGLGVTFDVMGATFHPRTAVGLLGATPPSSYPADFNVYIDAAGTVGQVIRGACAQTGDALQITNHCAAVLSRVDAAGSFFSGAGHATGIAVKTSCATLTKDNGTVLGCAAGGALTLTLPLTTTQTGMILPIKMVSATCATKTVTIAPHACCTILTTTGNVASIVMATKGATRVMQACGANRRWVILSSGCL